MSNQKTEQEEEVRRPRVPFGSRRTKLQLSAKDAKALADAGWTCRWVSDKDGRIEQAIDGGYVHVAPEEARSVGSTDLNDKVSKIVSRGTDEPIRGFLMKIKTEYFKEDQLVKEQANLAYDDALNAGQPGGNVVDNQYVPEGHVNRV